MTYLESLAKQILICALVAMWTADTAGASAPYLVADIDQTAQGSDPASFVELDGRVYFSAFHPASGRELWASDGTAEGTRMVKDISPGEGSSEPSEPIVYEGRLFFSAETESHGRELWASDGTEDGTVLVRDIDPGPRDGNPADLVLFDGLVFFSAADYGDRELWSSDGTEAGTRMFVDIVPGLVGSGAGGLTVSGDRLFFYADVYEYGREPWVSDGTVDGTRMLADVWPGMYSGLSGYESVFVGRDGFAYFNTADNAITDLGLWFTDGTPEGTRRLDLTAVDDPREPEPFTFLGGRLLFTTWGDRLWALADGVLEELGDFWTTRYPLTVGEEVFFSDGRELWRSDGTPEGTRPFLDSVPGGSANLRPIAFENGRLWFTQSGGSYGLWISDGTPEATVRVRESGLGHPRNLSFQNGRMWFEGSDEAHGAEPWASDGTVDGTRLVRDIDDVRTGSFHVGHLEPISRGRMLIFGSGELWVTDGSSSGTTRVPGSEQFGRVRSRVAHLGERVYFEAESPGTGNEIWWSDGDRVGLLADLAPGEADIRPLAICAVGNRLVFVTGDDERIELWSSDGDTVERLAELTSDEIFGDSPEIGAVAVIRRLGDSALVFASWNQHPAGREEVLWRTDGTAAGTRRVTRLSREPNPPSTALAGYVYFLRRSEQITLWKTDGTAAGTVAVTTLPPEVDYVESLETVGGHLALVITYEGVTDVNGLWISDGTAAGTVQTPFWGIRDIAATPGRLWIGGRTRSPGNLHQIDADSLTVERSLDFDGAVKLTPFGGVLYVGVTDFVTPGELWRTDGTAEGTVRLGPPAPVTLTSPRALGSTLFFPGNHPIYGTELWAVNHECVPSSETLCLAGDRFQARSLWRDRSGDSSPGSAAELDADAGTFWFFDGETPELAVKVLDGRSLNDHFWAFSGAATDLAVELHLLDVVTGAESRHLHPAGDLSSVADVLAFADSTPPEARRIAAVSGPDRVSVSTRETAPGLCRASSTTLCLLGGRFALSLERRDGTGSPAPGFARPISDRAGALSYFRSGSPELIAKAHDGRPFNGHFWIFVGALTDLSYDLTVTDTVTGAQRVYTNPPGRVGGFADVEAFGGSPRP
ncbi:MAG: ELWxxDGT repeat protein [Thermoanaerobaculia bacterium]